MSLGTTALILALGRGAASIIGLFSLVALTRLLPREEFGLYQQVWLVYNTALPFMMLGLPSGITYFVPREDRHGQKSILLQTAILLGFMGLTLATGTYLFSNQLGARFGGPELSELLRVFCWYPVLSFPLLTIDVFLIAVRRPATAGMLTLFSAVVQLAAIIIPIALGWGLVRAIQILCAATLLNVIFSGAITLRGYGRFSCSWDLSFLGRLIRYTLPLAVATIFGSLILQMGKMIVASRYSSADYALYDVAARELPFVGIITGSIMATLVPEFVRRYAAGDVFSILRTWRRATTTTALFLIPLTGLLMSFAQDVVIVLFSDKFKAADGLFMVFLLLIPLRIAQYGAIIIAAGQTRFILWTHFFAVLLCATVCIVFMSFLGMLGVAIGTVLTVYSLAFLLLQRCKQILGVGLTEILPWGKLAYITVAVAFASVVASWSTFNMKPGLDRFAIGTLIFSVVSIPVQFCIRRLRQDLISIFRHIVCPNSVG
jgi:O-antigen/teichoic acid export membrane protein